MRATISFACAAASMLFIAVPARAADSNCPHLMPPSALARGEQRPITASDLIGLRDIGLSGTEDAPLAISADGSHLAFQLRQANLSTNSYCLGMFVMSLDAPNKLHAVNLGGDIQFAKVFIDGGLANRPVGAPDVSRPKWSPDGHWIAFLRRDVGVTQLWRARSDGSFSEALTSSTVDIDDFAWQSDGVSLVVETHPGLAIVQQQISVEGETGFHVDDRAFPSLGNRPLAIDRSSPTFVVVNASNHDERSASPSEASLLAPRLDPMKAETYLFSADGGAGRRAWTSPADEQRPLGDQVVVFSTDSVGKTRCAAAECRGHILGLWWPADRSMLYFLKTTGEAASRMTLYGWIPGRGQPQALFSTDDLLTGCVPGGARLVCLDEGSTSPRHILTVALDKTVTSFVFDPNREFAQLEHGLVRRLYWRNNVGIETFGDLVLPPHAQTGARLPLIVVQYSSRGFLRGGTGDEYPIELFALAGYAVLSVQRPPDVGLLYPVKTGPELYKADLQNFADKRSVLSSLEIGIKLLVDSGIVDPERIGLTGLSDGATNVHWALLHSHVFAAVALSSCCEDEDSFALLGPIVSRYFHDAGAPRSGDRADAYWGQYGISRNAGKIDVPILLQTADSEMLPAYLPMSALKENNKYIDAYVYPDEYHLKWQPLHRWAIYARNLRWFDFWLKPQLGEASPNPAARWKAWQAVSARPVPHP